MDNGPFTDDVPIKTSFYNGFSIVMLNNQMVLHFTILLMDPAVPSERKCDLGMMTSD